MNKNKRKRKLGHSTRYRLLPYMLLGAGLMVWGVAAFILLGNPSNNPAQTEAANRSPISSNFPAPDLQLTDLEGNPTSLADLRGQVVLINNWATWCPPCREEMPELEAFYQQYKESEFTLVAIDAGEPAADVQQFVTRYSLSFPVWLDPDQQSLRAFRNPALPSTYVIDREGIVRLAWSGAITREILESYVAPMLEE
jgi:cytochrome c biogenesis protein CcmG, thiol:disulfide interchange protein DsbE